MSIMMLYLLCLSILSCIFIVVNATVVAARSTEGIVLGADSVETQGPLVGNRNSQKIFRLSPHTVLCCATSSADAYNLCRELRAVVAEHASFAVEELDSTSTSTSTCSVTSNQGQATEITTSSSRAGGEEEEIKGAGGGAAGSTGSGNGGVRGLGTRALAKYARRMVHDRYPHAHVIIAGIEGCRGKVAAQFAGGVVGGDGGGSVSSAGGGGGGEGGGGVVDDEYSIHEILPGGTIMQQDVVAAGAGADGVLSLLHELYSSSSSSNVDDEVATNNTSGEQKEQQSSSSSSSTTTTSASTTSSTTTTTKTQLGRSSSSKETARRLFRALQATVRNDARSGGEIKLWTLSTKGNELDIQPFQFAM